MQHRGDDRDGVRGNREGDFLAVQRRRRISSGRPPLLRNNKKNQFMKKTLMWGISFLSLVFVSIFKSMHLLEQQEQRHVLLRIGSTGTGMNKHHSDNSQRNIENAETYRDIIQQQMLHQKGRNALLRDEMAINQNHTEEDRDRIDNDNDTGRFIIFKKILSGQGAGNLMNGLLAAHLLGQEFNRTVCVEKAYTQFHAAFEAIDPHANKHCPALFAANSNMVQKKNHLEALSFFAPPNECHLQERLASEERVVTLLSNTYPRWPIVKEENFFFRHYRPRQALIDILPYSDNARSDYGDDDDDDRQRMSSNSRPLTVVHLRAPDDRQRMSSNSRPLTVVHLRAPDPGAKDRRNGLDEGSLVALGETLPRGPSTYLVTNRVDWYQRFEENYGWSHPNWETVAHSGQVRLLWEGHNGEAIVDRKPPKQPKNTYFSSKTIMAAEDNATVVAERKKNALRNNLQMWADWYTLLRAKTVYHTHSDFSNSAVHWMNIDSWIINGYNESSRELILLREPWLRDGVTPPLRDRRQSRVDDGDGDVKDDDDKATLRHCTKSVETML